MDFKELQHDYYHHVSVGPSEPRVPQLKYSDIVFHLPVLEYFASKCQTVTEFGVREGFSTVALLSGCKGEVYSYDIEITPIVRLLRSIKLPCRWEFQKIDTGSMSDAFYVKETDLLFIDTLHTFEHVDKELILHGRKANKYLAFHDTFTCGQKDLSGPDPSANGISHAINKFLHRYPDEYKMIYETTWSNGLQVYERLN